MKKSPTPIFSGATPEQVTADLAPLVEFQDDGLPLAELETMIERRLLPHLMRYERPQFQSMFNTIPSPEAQLGAATALAHNQGVTNWQVSPGGALLEELCVRALCRLFQLGPEADATFMYSGTYGNQQALFMALHRHAQQQGFDLAQKGIAGFKQPDRLAVLVAEGAHFSVNQAVRMLGLGERSIVKIPVDDQRRLDVTALRTMLKQLQRTREVVSVVVTAGTTSTGAVDPIAAVADLCAASGAWLHVDGAYGYAYKLVPEWTPLFDGDDRADSIVWDPHKQLGAPIPNSVLFVGDGKDFGRMTLYADYFNRAADEVPNPGLKSPPTTRPMSALPLVTILRGQGLRQVIANLRAPLTAIRSLADFLNDHSEITLCHRPDTGIICFRLTPPGLSAAQTDSLQQHIYTQVMAGGRRSISITSLGGQPALRLVIVSPTTTFDDLHETILHLLELTRAVIDSDVKNLQNP